MRWNAVFITLIVTLPVDATPTSTLTSFCKLYAPDDTPDQTPVDIYPVAIDSITVDNLSIFDEEADDAFFLHRFANWFHINTRKNVILEQLSVSEGDTVTNKDLEEAERILRSKPFIRDAQIVYPSECLDNTPQPIHVMTWDTWSLLPTIDFGRSSGNNRFAIGVKEENLLGYGIRSSFKFKTDNQRTGYHVVLSAPVPWDPQSTSSLILDNYDDGHLYSASYDKPFYQMTSDTMYRVSATSELKDLYIFHNGQTEDRYNNEMTRATLQYGWLDSLKALTTSRYMVGLDFESQTFNYLSDTPFSDNAPPADFRLLTPWVGWQFTQHHYAVMQDIYLTNQNEDINLGSDLFLKAGPVLNHNALSSWQLNASLSQGWGNEQQLLLTSLDASTLLNTDRNDRVSLHAKAEFFTRFNRTYRWYTKAEVILQNRVFEEKPLGLGGETGLRGFPEDYQHGTWLSLFTNELRIYPEIEIYQLFDVAMAGFIDIGKTGGNSRSDNITNTWLGSAGIGFRLYSSRSTNDNVVHIDLTTPFGHTPQVDNWEIGFRVTNRF